MTAHYSTADNPVPRTRTDIRVASVHRGEQKAGPSTTYMVYSRTEEGRRPAFTHSHVLGK